MNKNRLYQLMFSAFLTSVLLFFPFYANSQDDQQEWVITNSIGMKLKKIPAGSFTMGSAYEGSQRRVTISESFYIGVYEVTQSQWEKVMGTNPSNFKDPDRPVELVSWNDAVEFCHQLSQLTGESYRLPSEAEWEYAYRAGTTTKYYWGKDMNGDYAWYNENSAMETHKVGLKLPNAWGLYDMSGNVWEWCKDYWHYILSDSAQRDPTGPSSGNVRVMRGGCWNDFARNIRSSKRGTSSPGDSGGGDGVGFRVVRDVECSPN